MPVEKIDVKNLHRENKAWKNELLFVADEIKIYENRLSELVVGDTTKDMLRSLEHFQNQFIREKEVIDQLIHDVKVHEHNLVELVREDVGEEESVIKVHYGLKDRMKTFRKIFGALKEKFYQFLAEWM